MCSRTHLTESQSGRSVVKGDAEQDCPMQLADAITQAGLLETMQAWEHYNFMTIWPILLIVTFSKNLHDYIFAINKLMKNTFYKLRDGVDL